ncbi:transposase mutator type [Thiorhodococcus drewsii AZ1]|uniref:Mutator family transposase n=1 Tax=Thiorhodococcus drewsii AZ1 TaxID=765913 RepID=G2E5M5_9GAMM|nr:transposase mutator type [Thiorhodococcus drewsii AZ1]
MRCSGRGARELIAQAVEAELASFLAGYADQRLEDGRRVVVRNGYLPERTVQTGLGDVTVKVPKVRDRRGGGAVFHSSLLPPYLKRSRSVEELIPWLYLKGISTGDYQEALGALLGDRAKGLSANTVVRLKQQWSEEHRRWSQRDLSDRRYVYWWADGVYSNVRQDDRVCLLVIVGVTEHGHKELVAVEDGYRESEASWGEVLTSLRERGLTAGPKLAVGDGALGFWKALTKAYPDTVHQRCWVHKTANVLAKLPKSVQPKVKTDLQEIWMAETRQSAIRPSSAPSSASRPNIRRPWAAWPRIARPCSPSTTIRPSIGCTFAPPTRSNRPSPPCACAPTAPATAGHARPRWRWSSSCSSRRRRTGGASRDLENWNWSSITSRSAMESK